MHKDRPPMPRKPQLLWTVLALAALAGVFMLYSRSDFLVQLSNQVWSCF